MFFDFRTNFFDEGAFLNQFGGLGRKETFVFAAGGAHKMISKKDSAPRRIYLSTDFFSFWHAFQATNTENARTFSRPTNLEQCQGMKKINKQSYRIKKCKVVENCQFNYVIAIDYRACEMQRTKHCAPDSCILIKTALTIKHLSFSMQRRRRGERLSFWKTVKGRQDFLCRFLYPIY